MRHEHGFSLLELVIAVAGILTLTVGSVVALGTGLSHASAEKTLQTAVSAAENEALAANFSYDDNVSAETVIAQWNAEHEDIEFRLEGEGIDICVYGTHEDVEEEAWSGWCPEREAPESIEITYPTSINQIKCQHEFGTMMDTHQIVYFWGFSAPVGSTVQYEVSWVDTDADAAPVAALPLPADREPYISGGTGSFITNQLVFAYSAPLTGEAGTTSFTITPIVDGEYLEPTTIETLEVDAPDTRLCAEPA